MTVTRSPAKVRSISAIGPFHRAKLAFLVAGFLSLVLSVSLWFSGFREAAIFVGLWVGAIHSLGALVLVGENPAKANKHV